MWKFYTTIEKVILHNLDEKGAPLIRRRPEYWTNPDQETFKTTFKKIGADTKL